jgi:hypothetical protein
MTPENVMGQRVSEALGIEPVIYALSRLFPAINDCGIEAVYTAPRTR